MFKKSGNKLSIGLSAAFIIITAGINIFGYFNLPEKISTQISTSGKSSNTMSTPLYLVVSFLAVVLLSFLFFKSENEQKIKWLVTNIIIVIANIVMIAVQL